MEVPAIDFCRHSPFTKTMDAQIFLGLITHWPIWTIQKRQKQFHALALLGTKILPGAKRRRSSSFEVRKLVDSQAAYRLGGGNHLFILVTRVSSKNIVVCVLGHVLCASSLWRRKIACLLVPFLLRHAFCKGGSDAATFLSCVSTTFTSRDCSVYWVVFWGFLLNCVEYKFRGLVC